ncbi:MAG: hypothetical protein QOC95_534 [Thermoleophilaceae bacterium]|nr:hypothetical protein [Thermoleophilaceae bacterium]
MREHPDTSISARLLVLSLALAALALALTLTHAPPASASSRQATMLQDDPELLYGTSATRDSRLSELQSLGVDIVKVRVRWRDLAPSKPSNGADPSSYSAAAWAPYDAIVSGAASRGMSVMFQLGGTAPDWATPGKSAVDRPNASEFGKFVQAVGTRFPTVKIWSIWNEPNLSAWLSPQVKGGVPQAPRIYRGLVNTAVNGLKASGHGKDQILLGELLPFTRSAGSSSKKIRPLDFLREMACVDSHYRAFRGKAAKKRGCTHFHALPGTGLAYHPYTLAGGPNVRTPNKSDASISDLGRITSVLNKLRSKKRIQKRSMPIWITEFGFQTNPPDRYASPIKKVPGFMSQSEYIAYKNRRVASYSQYPLIDDAGKVNGFQSGLRFHNGKKKPGVFAAFQRPFYARKSGSRVELFGAVRASTGGTVTLQSRTSTKAKWKTLGSATLNSRGYFDKRFRVSRVSKRYFRFTGAGTPASRAAKASSH